MRNNNGAIVRKITKRLMRSNRQRNIFIIAAIALTAFMITSVFSVGISYYETMMLAPLRSEGMRTHAALADTRPEDIEMMRSLDYIRHIGTAYRVGEAHPEGFNGNVPIVALSEESWRFFQTPAFTAIEGTFATAENEIMLSRALLAQMGIVTPVVGMEIPLDFAIGDFNKGEPKGDYKGMFVLSAIYTEYVSAGPGNAFTPIFTSEAFAQRHGMRNTHHASVNVLFTNQNRAAEYAKRLSQDLNVDKAGVTVHPSLEGQANTGSSAMYIALGIITVFFMFVGFLLIFNVMYISVSKDVRFYGLMKTMGTTPRQIRRIVNGQILRMYFWGFPIGLATAALTSFVFVPALLNSGKTDTVISFSPLIYMGGAVFALITAYLGASVSAKKAAKVSPIEAIRYTGEQNIRMNPRSQALGKPRRMAWRNTFRERRRTAVVLLSLFLGITVFGGVMAIVSSMDITGNIDHWYEHDITISNTKLGITDLGLMGIDREIIDEIAGLPGVSEVREQTEGIAVFEYPPEVADLMELYQPLLGITGIDRAYMEELCEKMENPIDIEAFERGEIVLVDERKSKQRLGDMFFESFPVGTELNFEIGQQSLIPVSTKIAGYAEITNLTDTVTSIASGGLCLIMSNTFLDSIGGKAGANYLGINNEEGMDESVYAALSEIAERHGLAMDSAYGARLKQEEARMTMLVLGATISGILALIGIFNFINLISVGLLTRKREFAALESVGMTKKQMRLMLRWEGAIYWILTITASITAGTGIIYGLFRLIRDNDPMLLPKFIYPIAPLSVVFALIVLICTITPEICYRSIAKSTLVERLRGAE